MMSFHSTLFVRGRTSSSRNEGMPCILFSEQRVSNDMHTDNIPHTSRHEYHSSKISLHDCCLAPAWRVGFSRKQIRPRETEQWQVAMFCLFVPLELFLSLRFVGFGRYLSQRRCRSHSDSPGVQFLHTLDLTTWMKIFDLRLGVYEELCRMGIQSPGRIRPPAPDMILVTFATIFSFLVALRMTPDRLAPAEVRDVRGPWFSPCEVHIKTGSDLLE